MIKVLVLQQIGNPDGCTWYRLLQHTKMANKLKLADCQYLDLNLEEEQLKQVIQASDVLLVRLSEMLPQVIDWLGEFGIKKPIVLDVDDAIEDINPLAEHYRRLGTEQVKMKDGSFLWQDNHNGFNHFANRERLDVFKECLHKVDAIVTTTLEMKRWLDEYNHPVAIIPNSINFELFPTVKDPTKKETRLVWSGGASHFTDLQEIKGALDSVMYDYPNLHLYFLGMSFGYIEKGLPKDRLHTAGWVQAEAHGYRLACTDADISICPLIDSKFNHMKSSIKYYEMSALGVPTLARNIPPYSDDIVDGENGLLYSNVAEFERKLRRLIHDPLLRLRLGGSAFDYVSKNRRLEDITRDWVEFLEACSELHKA